MEAGPTRVVPGSHRWEATHAKPTDEQAAHAVMSKGSVVVYTGSVYHSGGNNVSGHERNGLNIDYNLAWLRQEENQYLACPPAIARDLPVRLQELIGYTHGGYALGYYGDLQSPKQALVEDPSGHGGEHGRGGQPINWATREWQDEARAQAQAARAPPAEHKARL